MCLNLAVMDIMQKIIPSPPVSRQRSNIWSNFEFLYQRLIPASVIIILLFLAVAASYVLVNVSPIIAIASLLAVPAFILLLSKPDLGLLLVIFVLPLEEFNVKGGFSAIKFISAAVFGCAILNYLIFRRREPLVRASQNGLIILFLLVSLISVFVAIDPARTLARLPKLLRVVALYFFVINLIKAEKNFQIALWLFLIGGFVCTLYGFFDPAQVSGRFQGALGQPNGYALTMTPRVPIALALLLIDKNFLRRTLVVFMLGTIIYGIILSGSRGGLHSISLALVLFAVLQKNRVVWLGIISAIFAIGLLIMPQDIKVRVGLTTTPASSDLGNSTDRRLTYQIYGAQLFQEHTIIGIGLDGFAEAYARSQYRFLIRTKYLGVAHNTYLEIATGTGVVGLIPFLGILGSAIFLAWKYSRKKYWKLSSELATISTGLVAALGGYYLGMLFGSRQYEKTLWFLLALPIVMQILINTRMKYQKNSENSQNQHTQTLVSNEK